nr:MAG TPA: CUE domain protein [Caudoviricetes sp.]
MHDFGKMWSGDGHGPYGASIVRQIFPKASNEQIQAIYEHMNSNPQNYISKLVKGADIKEPN